MILRQGSVRLLSLNFRYRHFVNLKCLFSQNYETQFSEVEREKILKVINNSDMEALSQYDITKVRAKKFAQWRKSNGLMQSLSDVETIEGFTEKTAKKFFDSILDDTFKKSTNKIKGQILNPPMSPQMKQECQSALALFVSVNCVCWALIDRGSYELLEWKYHSIEYPDGRKLQIPDIINISWTITQRLPVADVYVMKAEATTLRAAGSDPNNPKVIAVNLQKAQMISMIVALVNARNKYTSGFSDEEDSKPRPASPQEFKHCVYFLRPTLPYRLYGTLVGTEKVSTDQTVEMLLQKYNEKSKDNSHVFINESLKNMFRSQKELQKDMLGHCLLLGLTFMDLCIYNNEKVVEKLMKGQW